MYADGILTNYFGRLLPRSHSGSIHPVGWIKGDAVAVSQSQVLQALSVREGCDSQLIHAHFCPAQAGQHREEALPLPAPTYTAQLTGEHREHR